MQNLAKFFLFFHRYSNKSQVISHRTVFIIDVIEQVKHDVRGGGPHLVAVVEHIVDVLGQTSLKNIFK